jgi:hypothetical protein
MAGSPIDACAITTYGEDMDPRAQEPRRPADDDWVGVPPEGRHSRDRARPGYWQNQWQAIAARAILPLLAILAVVLIVVLS